MKDLFEEVKGHLSHYLALLVILDLGLGAFLIFRYNFLYQTIVILATSLAYIAWGAVHHWLEEDFHLRVILEYILLAVLADLVILFLLFRA